MNKRYLLPSIIIVLVLLGIDVVLSYIYAGVPVTNTAARAIINFTQLGCMLGTMFAGFTWLLESF